MTRPDPTAWKCWRDPRHVTVPHKKFGWPVCKDCLAKPSYPERFGYLPEDFEVAVFVPDDGLARRLSLAARTAVVGMPHINEGRVEIYYEGWINGPAQYGDRDARGLWEAGVEHAAGREVVRYPTSAKSVVAQTDLTVVGSYLPKTKRLVIDDEATLNAWLEVR